MPAHGRMDITAGTHTLAATRWTWGAQYPPERRCVDGWGTEVETTAVLELLDLVTDGEITAQEARTCSPARPPS